MCVYLIIMCPFNLRNPNIFFPRFDKDLFTAKDNSCPSVSLLDARKRTRDGSRVLRATFKSSIDIPNPNTFVTDYKKAMTHASEKYVMQNIDRTPPQSTKKRKGRPRKNPDNPKTDEAKMNEASDEDDVACVGDPPLFSDEEDEDYSLTVPSVAKTRSGRTVKTKKKDETFSYYDVPGSAQSDTEDRKDHRQRDESYSMKKNKKGKKRKMFTSLSQKPSASTKRHNSNAGCGTTLIAEEKNLVNSKKTIQPEDVDGSVDAVGSKDIKSESVDILSKDKVSVSSDKEDEITVDHLHGFVCFACFKEFPTKEECDKHTEEHMRRGTYAAAETPSDSEKQEHTDIDVGGIISVSDKSLATTEIMNVPDRSLDTSLDTPEKAPAYPSISNTPKAKDLTCSTCKISFKSQDAFDSHSHDAIHECKVCGKKYQSRINLQSHIKKYHEETEWMKFRCATCGKSFGFLVALERHMKEHNPNQKFCCDQCGKVFKTLTNLKNHIPLHTKDEVFRCPYCPKEYYIRYSYDKHVKSHLYPPKFHCEVCNKYFTDKKYFEVHLQRHQSGGCLGRSNNLRCNNCGDIKTPTELEIVSGTDPGHHKTCLECGKGLYKKYMLENTDSLPLQEKPVREREREQCKLCGKFVVNMMRHVKKAHLENSYTNCDVCGAIVTKASLASHKNRKHGGSAVTCDHCNKVFKNIMCLREHMTKVRRKEDPAKQICKLCKDVVDPAHWKEHMKLHSMKCGECGASEFRNQDEFMVHLEVCRRCSSCGTSGFTSQEDYLAHVEMCGSSIDIMTGTLDAAGDQEVVTSIFAIVDDGTCCGTCGEDFEDQIALANHITEVHQDSLPASHTLRETDISEEDVLYACPQETCGVILTSKEMLSNHLTAIHNS